MTKLWLLLVALWRILVWKVSKDEDIKKKREAIKKEVVNAVKNGDTRNLHRIMSGL